MHSRWGVRSYTPPNIIHTMKLKRKVLLEILKYATEQIARTDKESWELIVDILRHTADTIEASEK